MVRHSNASSIYKLCNSLRPLKRPQAGPTTPNPQRLQAMAWAWFGLFPFRSPLLRESLLFSLPPGTEMFHFPGYYLKIYRVCLYGFSHSEILGSILASSSPRLIAGNHVLHRHAVSRHPSYALTYLTILCYALVLLFNMFFTIGEIVLFTFQFLVYISLEMLLVGLLFNNLCKTLKEALEPLFETYLFFYNKSNTNPIMKIGEDRPPENPTPV